VCSSNRGEASSNIEIDDRRLFTTKKV